MEKQLGWAHKLGGSVSLGIFREEQKVLARLMESQIWHLPTSSVALPTFLSDRKPSPSSLLDVSHFSSSLCVSLVPFKLLSLSCRSEGVSLSKSMCGFFKRNYLGLQQFLPLAQSLLVFAAMNLGDLSSWHWNPGLGSLVWGWDFSLLRHPL